jgi:hypothetical protein
MKTWLSVCAVALLAACSVSEAHAQAGPQGGGSKPTPFRDQIPRQQARTFEREVDARMLDNGLTVEGEAASKIAECLARRGGENAGGYLGGVLLKDPNYSRVTQVLKGKFSNCRREVGNASPFAINGALAEQLLLAEAPKLADREPAEDKLAGQMFFGDFSGPVALDNVAGCLAVYSPGLSYKVLQTKPDSPEEAAALSALYSQSPECGIAATPSGFEPEYQRGVIATALHGWLHPHT